MKKVKILKFIFIALPCAFFIACGDKNADVTQGGGSEMIQPQQQEEVFAQEEVIEEYTPQKPALEEKELKTVYFAFDSFALSKEMFSVVDQNAELLKQHLDLSIVLEGNTDAYGSDEYNLALGNKRALAVKEALVVRGIKKEQIEVVSFGETKPVCTRDNGAECRQENRRVDFVLKSN